MVGRPPETEILQPPDARRGERLSTITGVVSQVQFSLPHGFYEAPFDLALSNETAGSTIRYTTDGSEPTVNSGGAVPRSGSLSRRSSAPRPSVQVTPVPCGHSHLPLPGVRLSAAHGAARYRGTGLHVRRGHRDGLRVTENARPMRIA